MKKILILLLPFVFLFSNCGKDDDFLFQMNYLNDFTIPAGLNPFAGTHVFETAVINSNSAAIFTQNSVTAAELQAINPHIAVLRGIFSAPDNGYIQEVSVKMFDADDPTFEKEIFYRDQIPNNSSGDLALIGTLVDVKDFIAKETYGIRVELKLRDISPETIDIRLDFSVVAK